MSADDIDNFDILAWWKGREAEFPVISAMTRDLLSSQASTVASESAFSTCGRVISLRRTRLSPEAVKMCICLKDHLDATRLDLALDPTQPARFAMSTQKQSRRKRELTDLKFTPCDLLWSPNIVCSSDLYQFHLKIIQILIC
ncbi:hypothetical protein QVD17_11707 [Tagetes erecta]|uniref:HAT C-terminal dimerisation domain-containing protein n=1 Tax=Tagetes erecta TaxID=13708 RepID=A0AAD8P150_TARER|nr:hypothetical protein QVD17_11707 [Tagetes erecta]